MYDAVSIVELRNKYIDKFNRVKTSMHTLVALLSCYNKSAVTGIAKLIKLALAIGFNCLYT